MTRVSSGRGGGMLPNRPRRKGPFATAADLYATDSGFRFLLNFVFFGWLTLLCLFFSSNLGTGLPALGGSGFSAPLKLDGMFAPSAAAPAEPATATSAQARAGEPKASTLLEALGPGAQAAPVLADYKLAPKASDAPAAAVADLTAGRQALDQGGTANIEAGFVRLKSAADAGLPAAMALYGLARMAPPGALPADAAAGREWLQRAAQGGDAQAARLLARAYLTGSAGFSAPDKARDLFRRGQQLGDAASALELARLLAGGQGGPADPAGAEQTLRIAAARGDPTAMAALGRYLTLAAANGWSPSFDEATLWLTRAAAQGDTSAMERLGDIHMFLAKAPPAQNPVEGFAWYKRCAEAGSSACHYAVGRAYALAVGTAADLPRAWAHLTLARNAGRPKAAAELTALEARMTAADRDEGLKRLTELQARAG
jgi:TPR repeat protein